MSKDDFTKFLDRVKDGIARFPMDVANIIAETAASSGRPLTGLAGSARIKAPAARWSDPAT